MSDYAVTWNRTAAEWSGTDPFVPRNQLAVESDTGRQKVGLGLRWSDTPYLSSTNIVRLSQAEYDALTPDSDTLYIITS